MTEKRKDNAVEFLKLASAGDVDMAYEKYVHKDFIHHNPYFKGDRESLLLGMKENAKQFPNKIYETLHVIGDGNYVAVHGKVTLSPEMILGVIHIFRFAGDKIIESWEASQEVFKDSSNEQAVF